MKRPLMVIILAALLCGVAAGGDTIERTFTLEKGKLLEIDLNTGGSINIGGWDKNEAKITAFVDGRDWEDCSLDFDEKTTGLEITSHSDKRWGDSNCNVDLEIRIPAESDLDVRTAGGSIILENIKGKLTGKTNGGRLAFEMLEGDIYFRTNGGSIDCENLKGTIDIKTNGGSISCSDSRVDGRLHTNGGSIRIIDVTGDLDFSTNGGSVSYGGSRSRESSGEIDVVKIKTMGGSIDVDWAPKGADVKTNGGSISVNKAGEFVVAKTNGGSIYIGEIDGWVEAHTNGGDVTVEETGAESGKDRSIDISSNGGEIKLTLPADFSATFDIELAYTRNARREYRIISDFDIDTQKSDDWESSFGSRRKFIEGTGSVNGGNNKVRIKTINGDVIIKKG